MLNASGAVLDRARALALAVAMAVAVAACSGDVQQDSDRLTVVATTTILGDVVTNVAGGDAEVVVLAPLGVDPHDFRASASQVAIVSSADLVVANGLFLEEGLEDVLDAASEDGANVFEIGPSLDPLPFHLEGGDGAVLDPEDHGSDDPHVWFDPLRMAEAARLIAAELEDVDPGRGWIDRADAYAQELVDADATITAALASIPRAQRLLVTNHDSLGYFAERYDFEIVGTVIPSGSTLADPSSEELSELIEIITEQKVTAIFGETTQPGDLARAVASEIGTDIQVVSLYTGSLGEPGSGAETLIGMLVANAQLIAASLSS